MQVLAMFLNHNNTKLVENVLWILRNLSDAATKQVLLVMRAYSVNIWEEVLGRKLKNIFVCFLLLN